MTEHPEVFAADNEYDLEQDPRVIALRERIAHLEKALGFALGFVQDSKVTSYRASLMDYIEGLLEPTP